jgi:predicted anti-sigma-YlaC factor YlaD
VNLDNEQHLDEQQLIQAVVDESDLPRSVQMHLGDCHQCRSEKESFEQELAALGQVSERYAPQPQRRIVLPVQDAGSPRWSFLNWRHAIGAAAAVALVVVVFWGSTTLRDLTGYGTAGSPSELMEARQLMTEVNMLVDNALPPLYLEISAEYKPDDDKDFYQFLIPQIET